MEIFHKKIWALTYRPSLRHFNSREFSTRSCSCKVWVHKLNFAHQESKWSPNTWSPNIDTGEGLMHRAGSSLHWDFWFLVWDIFSISNLYLLNWEGSDYPRSQPRTILFKLFFSSPRLTWKFSGREGRMAGVGSAKEIFGHLACAKGWPKRGKKKKQFPLFTELAPFPAV